MNNLLTLFAVGAMFSVSGSLQGRDSWTEQYSKAKHGRRSPSQEARQRAAQANTAWRVDPSAEVPPATPAEEHFKAKLGRSHPSEEARRKAAQANSAWREEPSTEASAQGDTWTEPVFRTKYGRSSPREEARREATQTNIPPGARKRQSK